MLTLNDRRTDVRQSLGYSKDEFVVLLMGTWKSDSMMESAGRELMAEAIKLRERFRFIFSTHPLHWSGEYAKQHPWGQFLSDHEQPGIAVLRPDDDWERAAVAADLAISDHSSVGVKFALLKKPLLFLEAARWSTRARNICARLDHALPHLCGTAAPDLTIDTARKNYPIESLAKIADEINSYPRQAAQRIQSEIYQLLDL